MLWRGGIAAALLITTWGVRAQAAAPEEEAPESKGLREEVYLHPMDGFTGHTLEAGTIVYCQSVGTLPLPSWMWVGVTDWLTAEIDLLPLLGGLLVPPHRPVPSFNFRFRLFGDGARREPAMAVEVMWQHLWLPYAQEDRERLRIVRQGSSLYQHLNLSLPVAERSWLHLSAGVSYAADVAYSDPQTGRGRRYKHAFSPDVSVSFDWRIKEWLSLHLTGSYGVTFIYSDNIPRKVELMAGARVAPFYRWKRGFFNTMRFEFPAFFMYFPEASYHQIWPLPIIPYVYWQW